MSSPGLQNDNLRGGLLMVLAMAGFAAEDALMKLLSGSVSVGVLILLVGGFSTCVMLVVALRNGAPLFSRDFFHPAVLLRNICEMLGAIGFVTALVMLSLQMASALFQTLPLAITMGAAIFLGEKVGWRRWTAVAVGFLGVMVILRPTGAGFDPFAAGASMLAVFSLAARDLATRRIPARINSTSLAVWGMFSYMIAGALLLPFGAHGFDLPAPRDLALIVVIASCGLIGYLLLIAASRIGEISAIMPFRYTRLIFALGLGALLFGETPDAYMILGSVMVVGSGVYTFLRERYHASKRAA
ncbi:DMT family transporter [Falsigemmobacter faecalis]|uniref:DMT family transporter n=1 Tax=Falsigemmobacter faecalis TaxID=2488730 RepID=A0A3P3DLL3_9RHOB|nr:DMT family transporter [Falsigemmobacter faecalis]RRH75137.1 DMT family transporter [Falsigemmobacter faecalis]